MKGLTAFNPLSALVQADAIIAEILNPDAENRRQAEKWDNHDGREVFALQ
jgi:hypothetical protein